MEPNLPKQNYKTESTEANLSSIMFEMKEKKCAEPNLFNQTYKTNQSTQYY